MFTLCFSISSLTLAYSRNVLHFSVILLNFHLNLHVFVASLGEHAVSKEQWPQQVKIQILLYAIYC